MTSPFKKMFLVQHFGSFGSNQYDYVLLEISDIYDGEGCLYHPPWLIKVAFNVEKLVLKSVVKSL